MCTFCIEKKRRHIPLTWHGVNVKRPCQDGVCLCVLDSDAGTRANGVEPSTNTTTLFHCNHRRRRRRRRLLLDFPFLERRMTRNPDTKYSWRWICVSRIRGQTWLANWAKGIHAFVFFHQFSQTLFFFAFCELHPLCGFLFFSFWLMAKNTSKGFLVSFAPAAPAEEKKEKTPKEFPISQKSNKPLTNQPLPTTETKKKEEKKKKESREKQQQVMLCWLPLFLALVFHDPSFRLRNGKTQTRSN